MCKLQFICCMVYRVSHQIQVDFGFMHLCIFAFFEHFWLIYKISSHFARDKLHTLVCGLLTNEIETTTKMVFKRDTIHQNWKCRYSAVRNLYRTSRKTVKILHSRTCVFNCFTRGFGGYMFVTALIFCCIGLMHIYFAIHEKAQPILKYSF